MPAPDANATACPTARRRISRGTPPAATATACPTSRLRIGEGTKTARADAIILARTTMCPRWLSFHGGVGNRALSASSWFVLKSLAQ